MNLLFKRINAPATSQKINWFKEESKTFQFLTSLWIWFLSFISIISIFWFIGFYNFYVVFVTLIAFIWFSYREILSNLKWLYEFKFELDDHDFNWNFFQVLNFRLLTTEFLFVVISLLISVNFINIIRPLPIWWDDLWVYMNNPQLLANAWKIIPLWGMFSWQIFTWIWFMFKSATQAFFLNNVWWVLSVIVIALSISDLLKNVKKTFINIPLLSSAIIISMPMVVFQQAKDMKLDPGLLFVTVIVIYMTFYIFLKYIGYTREIKTENFELSEDINSNSKTLEITVKTGFNNLIAHFSKYTHIGQRDIFSNKTYLIYIFIIWLLAWLAFSIKFTSLLLISWILAVIFYSKLFRRQHLYQVLP